MSRITARSITLPTLFLTLLPDGANACDAQAVP